ncbi:MAG: tRNA (adenosine(37)-N6)-threonylcarbamoyltransferase complex dimerization subunit type 1 TsaB [Oscillospiraceae bacterium]
MILLGMDTSAVAASAALWEDGRMIGESFVNVKLTHSQTILPMTQNLLNACGKDLSQVDEFAVSTGPGSFTGLRIGISAVKGMAFGTNKRCIPVSTLEALAYLLVGQECIAVAAMDARCQQVYAASFLVGRESVQRLSEDAALSIGQLWEQINNISSDLPLILVGDGAQLCYNSWESDRILLAPEHLRFQRASAVCMAALPHRGMSVEPAQLVPQYLRLPQAQRELLQKRKQK